MEASTMKTVSDVTSKGGDFRPAGGNTNGWLPTPMSPAGPMPTPDPNPRKLDTSMTKASHAISNGQGSMYDGAPDNDADELPL